MALRRVGSPPNAEYNREAMVMGGGWLVRFVLYSDKTVAQCLTAINARMHAKGTSTHPALDGWVEKGGAFALGISTPVVGKFARRTTLKAKVERQSGVTIIRGSVPNGVSKQGQLVVFGALALLLVTMLANGNALFALLLIPFAAYLYIPMRGDLLNSEILIDEVQKTLKAKPKPPKKLSESKPSKPATSASRPATARASTPRKKSPEDQALFND